MEFRRHELGTNRHTNCASSPHCGPNDLRFCHSKGSALRRVRWNQLPGRHMALGWVDVTVDAGDTQASSSGCYRSDLFGGFDGQFYQLTMWQWNGSDWTQLSPSTVPFARASAAV